MEASHISGARRIVLLQTKLVVCFERKVIIQIFEGMSQWIACKTCWQKMQYITLAKELLLVKLEGQSCRVCQNVFEMLVQQFSKSK